MYKVIGKIPVRRESSFRLKKSGLSIGLVAFIVATIVEISMGNYMFMTLLIPGLYLLNIRIKMGKSVLLHDIEVTITNENSEITITQNNIIGQDNKTYSERYILSKNELKKLSYSKKALLTFAIGNSMYILLENDRMVSSKQLEKMNLAFYVSQEDANMIKNLVARDNDYQIVN